MQRLREYDQRWEYENLSTEQLLKIDKLRIENPDHFCAEELYKKSNCCGLLVEWLTVVLDDFSEVV